MSHKVTMGTESEMSELLGCHSAHKVSSILRELDTNSLSGLVFSYASRSMLSRHISMISCLLLWCPAFVQTRQIIDEESDALHVYAMIVSHVWSSEHR